MHLSEHDDAGREVIECEEAAFKLFIAHQKPTQTIEPIMADLHNLTPGLLSGMPLLGPFLLSATGRMRNVAVARNNIQRRLTALSGIQAQIFGATLGRCLAFDHDGGQDGIELRNIMSVRYGHNERQGDATAVDQQVTLAPIFFRSVGFGPTCSCASGALNMAPSILCHRQTIPSIQFLVKREIG